MVRMLHIVGSMSPSGIGNFIMNIYRNIDRKKVQFDFIVHEHREVSFDDEIRTLGGRLFYVTRKSVNPFQNFLEMRRVVKEGAYQIVFRHTDTATVALDLLAAKMGGAKRRIPHSHSTSTSNIKMHRMFQPFLNAVSTDYFACSEEAGRWLYGKKPYEVILNGIDVKQFVFSREIREEVRKQEGLSGQLVLGHVGNFLPVKNHFFMIEVLAEVLRQQENVILMLVGGGALEEQIRDAAEGAGVLHKIYFTGVRKDTARLLQAMDIFLFPSFYEGMPIALVEAQGAGLPCLVSEAVTEDVIVTDLVKKLEIQSQSESAVKVWAKAILEQSRNLKRKDTGKQIEESGFSTKRLAKRYEMLGEEAV